MKNSLRIIVIFFLFVYPLQFSFAQKEKSELTGEVSAISKDFIAIVFRRDEKKGTEEEIGLPIPKNVIVEHKKSLDQIAVGDMVSIQYDEVVEQNETGKVTKRVAKVISFVRAAQIKPQKDVLDSSDSSEDEVADEEDTGAKKSKGK